MDGNAALRWLAVVPWILGGCGSTQQPPQPTEPVPASARASPSAPPQPAGQAPTQTGTAAAPPPGGDAGSASTSAGPTGAPTYPNERFPGQCAQATADLRGPPPPPPQHPRDADNTCQTNQDCELAPLGYCRCPPVGYQWRYAVNHTAAEHTRNLWARRRCKQPVCPDCPGKLLGEETQCVAGQCLVR